MSRVLFDVVERPAMSARFEPIPTTSPEPLPAPAVAPSVSGKRPARTGLTSTFDVFALAERVELAAAELYFVIGQRPGLPDDDRILLRTLEEEEMQHAARIRLLTAQYRNDPKLFDVSNLDMAKLREVERWSREMREQVVSGRWDDDPQGLKLALIDLESRCSASHADILAERSDPSIAGFFRELAAQDKAHHHKLLESTAQPARKAAAR
jgi:hypothetical protein